MAAQEPIYTPPSDLRTNLDDFREYVNRKHQLQLRSYDDLHKFSTNRLNDFWMSVWTYAKIKASKQPSKAVDDDAHIDQFPKFFEDARLNYAENLLCGDDDAVAVIEMNELNLRQPNQYTWKDLRQLVARYAGVLKRCGVRTGDVVCLVGGNCARSLGFLLAAASVGAIFGSFATDMGEKALIERVVQLKPKVLISELRYRYNGRVNDISEKVAKCIKTVPGCQLVVSVESDKLPRNSRRLTDLLGNEMADQLRFEQLPFDTPFVIMFSSGTTGKPKGIVHRQGGLMINGIKEHLIHNNFGPNDVHFHFSGIGWTLWNISIGAMFCKTTMVFYDGSPFYPSCEEFLKAVFATGVTGYGGSPRYFSELQKRGVEPRQYATRMHSLLSTGALLTPGTATWLAKAFGPVCQIGFSGGTELCGNFMTGTRSLPCYAGEVAVKELGMDIEAWGSDGKSVPDGESGELVCKKPFPNMPVFFFNDPERKRYKSSYFEGFPGVWTHGDLIRINPKTKGIYVLGRSDGVLNPSGVRFGTSDLYNILSTPQLSSKILDGLAVGQQRATEHYSDPTERVILFLKVAENQTTGTPFPREDLLNPIRELITRDLSRRHIPHFFFEVNEIPHNANTKKMEIQVKQICNSGEKALEKMTITTQERTMLQDFLRFYDVEDVVKQNKGEKQSKL